MIEWRGTIRCDRRGCDNSFDFDLGDADEAQEYPRSHIEYPPGWVLFNGSVYLHRVVDRTKPGFDWAADKEFKDVMGTHYCSLDHATNAFNEAAIRFTKKEKEK